MKRLEQAPLPSESPWKNTSYANLIRYEPSGTYFARVRVGGKLIRQSLKTKVLTVAKLKLADLEKKERGKMESSTRVTGGKATVADLVAEYRLALRRDPEIKPRTLTYREECIARILKSWPELPAMDVRKLTEKQCEEWAGRFKDTCKAASTFNNTTGTLRLILKIAVKNGARYTNPALGIGRKPVRPKQLTLPSQEQFHELLTEVRRVPFGPGLAAAELIEFLAYSGLRKGEAANVTWQDCDFERGQIVVRGDIEDGTKNGDVRSVPMIPDMRQLLTRLKAKGTTTQPTDLVMRVHECQGTITRACKEKNIPRFTHHDLRHLFATRCIESGVDIPTVSRWLGHKDGGALAMKTYAHLRDKHSVEMAKSVTFTLTS